MNTSPHDTVNSIIETEQLVKRYDAVIAVDAVSLRVARGEINGFLGLNGAGKTTTIRALPHEPELVVLDEPATDSIQLGWLKCASCYARSRTNAVSPSSCRATTSPK